MSTSNSDIPIDSVGPNPRTTKLELRQPSAPDSEIAALSPVFAQECKRSSQLQLTADFITIYIASSEAFNKSIRSSTCK